MSTNHNKQDQQQKHEQQEVDGNDPQILKKKMELLAKEVLLHLGVKRIRSHEYNYKRQRTDDNDTQQQQVVQVEEEDGALVQLEELLELRVPRVTNNDTNNNATATTTAAAEAESEVWVPSTGPPPSPIPAPILDSDSNDSYEATILDEYGPFNDDQSKWQPWYAALAKLLTVGFQTNAMHVITPTDQLLQEEDAQESKKAALFKYSLPLHHGAVRCTRILHALLSLDSFHPHWLLHAHDTTNSSTHCRQLPPVLSAFLHHLSNLPTLETTLRTHQRTLRTLVTTTATQHGSSSLYGAQAQAGLYQAEQFNQRTNDELQTHATLLAGECLTGLYRDSPPEWRTGLRLGIGASLRTFALGCTNTTAGTSSTAVSSITLSSQQSATGIADVLTTLLRIIQGFQAPPMHASHASLLTDVLLPLHRPNGMVLWRDQTPIVELYHETLVACMSNILDRCTDGQNDDDNEEEVQNQKHKHKHNHNHNHKQKHKHKSHNNGTSDANTLPKKHPRTNHNKSTTSKSSHSAPPRPKPPSSSSSNSSSRTTTTINNKTKTITKSSLLTQIFHQLLHPSIWPQGRTTNTPKIVLLLHQMDTLLQVHVKTNVQLFQTFHQALLLRLCHVIQGENTRTVERALQYWKCDTFAGVLVGSVLEEWMGPLLKALTRSSSSNAAAGGLHLTNGSASSRRMEASWNPTVNKMTALVLEKLESCDGERSRRIFARHAELLLGDEEENKQTMPNMDMDEEKEKEKEEEGGPVVPAKGRQVDVSGMVSLSGAMGSWKPPPTTTTTTGRGMSSSKHGMTGKKNTMTAQPPSTITGVAPWAMKQPPHGKVSASGRRRKGSRSGLTPIPSSSSSSAMPPPSAPTPKHNEKPKDIVLPAEEDGVEVMRSPTPPSPPSDDDNHTSIHSMNHHKDAQSLDKKEGRGLARLRAFCASLVPTTTTSSSTDSDNNSHHGYNHWVAAQTAESPTLLPTLKFHDLVFGQELGKGAFGVVKYARQIVKTQTRSHWPEYAVKIIYTQKITSLGYESSMNREISILRTLSHPGIARLVSSFHFRDGAYLVLEYASQGDLHDFLHTQGTLTHESAKFVVGEVVAALRSVHEGGFVYGDLKPENVLLCESGHVKLTDFGACRPVTKEAKRRLKRCGGRNALKELRNGDWRESKEGGDVAAMDVSDGDGNEDCNMDEVQGHYEQDEDDNRIEGTTAYLPPEVAAGGIPNMAADAWALGCVLYQCLSGKHPLLDDTEELTKRRIVTFDISNEAQQEVFFGNRVDRGEFHPLEKALIQRLLQVDGGCRPDMVEVAGDAFFEGMDVFTLYRQKAPPLKVGTPAPNAGGAGRGAAGGGGGEDDKWSRRQFSAIWAPQPKAYDLQGTAVSIAPKATSSSTALIDARMRAVIEEGEERGGYFLPNVSSSNNGSNSSGNGVESTKGNCVVGNARGVGLTTTLSRISESS